MMQVEESDDVGLVKKHEKLGVVALSFVVFCSVSGGPFGCENLVQSAGPLYTLLLIFLIPLVCTTPLVFMIEEMCSWSPSRHGNIKFVYLAFGSKLGFVNSFFTIVYNLFALPVYAVYGINYLMRAFGKEAFDNISNNFAALYFMRAGFVLVFCIPSFFEIKEMGIVTGILTVLILSPFVVGFFAGAGNIDTSSWSATKSDVDFATAFSLTNFLYLGFLANASISGEVKQRALFKGQLIGLVLAVLVYFFPLVVTLQLNTNYKEWVDAYFVELFEMILKGLGPCVSVAGFLSGAALFSTALVCYTRSIWAVANLGWFPKIFLKTNRYNSPYVGAILHILVCFILILFDFEFLVTLENLLFTTLLILFGVSFIVLRYKEPVETRLSPRFVARYIKARKQHSNKNNNSKKENEQEEEGEEQSTTARERSSSSSRNQKSQQQEKQQEEETAATSATGVRTKKKTRKDEHQQKQPDAEDVYTSSGDDIDRLAPTAPVISSSSRRGTSTTTAGEEDHTAPIVLEDGFEDDDEEDLGVFVVPGGNCFASILPIPVITVMSATLVSSLTDFKMLGAYLACYLLAGCLFYYLNYYGKTEEQIVEQEAKLRSCLVTARKSDLHVAAAWTEGVGDLDAAVVRSSSSSSPIVTSTANSIKKGEEEEEEQEGGGGRKVSYGTRSATRRSLTSSEGEESESAAVMRKR